MLAAGGTKPQGRGAMQAKPGGAWRRRLLIAAACALQFTLYTPKVIVLSGGAMECADLFMPVIREAAAWRHRYPGGTRAC